MVIWGFTALKTHLRQLAFVLYWLVCLCLAFIAMMTALWDMRVISRRERIERQERREQTSKHLPESEGESTTSKKHS